MKPGLQRIEATLDQLVVETPPEETKPSTASGNSGGIPPVAEPKQKGATSPKAAAKASPKASAKATKPKLATIEPFPLPKPTETPQSGSRATVNPLVASELPAAQGQPILSSIQPFPTHQLSVEMPSLPRSKPTSVSSHRHAANPNLAVGVLKEIETKIRGWQQELEQVVQQIQSIYQDGPIVDGWLESHAAGVLQPMSPSASVLRHAEIEHLMEYVEQICQADPIPTPDGNRTDYRLCGLDADGKLWSRPCPAEQVPYVSLAIARYQKLRTLLARKQTLENRLTQLVETLTILHSQISEF